MRRNYFDVHIGLLEGHFKNKYSRIEIDGLWQILYMMSEPTFSKFVDNFVKNFKGLPRKADFLKSGRWMKDNSREMSRDNLAEIEGSAPKANSKKESTAADLTDLELTDSVLVQPTPTTICKYCLNDGYFSTYKKGLEEQGPFTFLCSCEMGTYFAWMQWRNYLLLEKAGQSPSKVVIKQWGTPGCEEYHAPDVQDVSSQETINPENYENPAIREIARRVKANFDANRSIENQKELKALTDIFAPGMDIYKSNIPSNSFDDETPF